MAGHDFSRLIYRRDAELRARAKEQASRRDDALSATHELSDAIRSFAIGRPLNMAVEGNKVILRSSRDALHITIDGSSQYLVQHLSRDGSPVRDSSVIRGKMEVETMMDAVLQWLGMNDRSAPSTADCPGS